MSDDQAKSVLEDYQWADFHKNVSGRVPRELLLDVLSRIEADSAKLAFRCRKVSIGLLDLTEQKFYPYVIIA